MNLPFYSQLSSKDFPSSTSTNTTTILQHSFDEFRSTYAIDKDDVRQAQSTMRDELNTLGNTMQGVQKHFTWVYDRIMQLQTALNSTGKNAVPAQV